MVRIAIIAVIITSITAVTAWVFNLKAENEQLTADLAGTVSANQTYIDAIAVMDANQREKEQQIIQREANNKQINRQLHAAKKELLHAKQSFTETEITCMDGNAPTPILNILRETDSNLQNKPAGKAMSCTNIVYQPSIAGIQRADMGRYCKSCASVAVTYQRAEQRPATDQRVLF